jgi:hypothetical protein
VEQNTITQSTDAQIVCKLEAPLPRELPLAWDQPTAGSAVCFRLRAAGRIFVPRRKGRLKKYYHKTFDCVTDRYRKRSYLNARMHYCDISDYRLHVVTMAIRELPHTGQNVAVAVEDILLNFVLLEEDIVAVVYEVDEV